MHRTALGLVCAAALACSANGHSPSAPGAPVAVAKAAGAAAPPTGDASGLLSPEALRPYFPDGAGRSGAEAFAAGNWREARDHFQAHLEVLASDQSKERGLTLLMTALASAELGDWAEAAAGYEQALVLLPHFSDWLHNRAARAHYYASATDRAIEHARAVSADSSVAADTELLMGDLLRNDDHYQQVAAHYQTYLDTRPRGPRRTQARFRLAEASARLGNREQAIAQYRIITTKAPFSELAPEAEKRISELLRMMPRKLRRKVAPLNAQQLVDRGKAYYGEMRNELSEKDFTAALSAPELTDDLRCIASYFRANSVFRQRDRKRAAPLFDEAITACAKTDNTDLKVKAGYQAGRCHGNQGDFETALKYWKPVEDQYPTHSYADDLRVKRAEANLELGNWDAAAKLLAAVPDLYPKGDMATDAVWRLGWHAYQEGDDREALRWWKKQVELAPVDDHFRRSGQPHYWMARSHSRLGNNAEALAAYREAIFRYPLSYYALLSLNRLRAERPAQFEKILAEMRAAPPTNDDGALRFHLGDRLDSPDLERAIDLHRLGLHQAAQVELKQLGITTPGDRKPVTGASKIGGLWLLAYLSDQTGVHSKSVWLTRWYVLDYRRHWPEGGWRTRWRIAYPLAYWDLLEKHAALNGVPTELLIAFVREESGFDPIRESFANAIGLTQMIIPTAKRFAEGTGIRVNRTNLRDPEKNVTIGSRFLGFLMTKWRGNIGLVVPSYNAGEGAVGRWLGERGDHDLDVWAEEIPYDETRGYTKRVISTYFTYAYLKDGTIPDLHLGPAKPAGESP